MKNAADLLHTIAVNHGVALPPESQPTPTKVSAAKRRRKTQDEDDTAPTHAAEVTSDSSDSADSTPTHTAPSNTSVQTADAAFAAGEGDAASTLGSTYSSALPSTQGSEGTAAQRSASDSSPLWLPLTVLAAGGVANYYANSNTASPSPTGFTVSGTAVLGPVIEGHSLTVFVYRADGTLLQQASVNPDGSYALSVTENYTGVLLLRLVDSSSDADYRDEASGTAKDLAADLRAATVITAPGSYTVHINPLTELVVRQLGLAGGDNASSAVSLAGVSASAIAQANSLVATALGLSGTNIVSSAAVAAVGSDGSANPAVNDLGLVLAALSGIEVGHGFNTEQMLQDLSLRLTDSSGHSALAFDLIAGLANVDSVRGRIGAFAQSLGLSSTDAQAAASAWIAIYALADGSAGSAARPSAQEYTAIGITGVQPAQASLLGDAIELQGRSAINSVGEVQSLADIATKVMLHAAGQAQTLTQAELESLGITALNPARLADLLHTLEASPDDGSGADTLAELQAMVDSTAPGAPSFDFAAPSGEPAQPYVVNIETAAIPLTGAVEGAATTVLLQIGILAREVAVTNGVWSYTLTAVDLEALDQSTVSLVATARDAAGNTSAHSDSLELTVDLLAPDAPALTSVTADSFSTDAVSGAVTINVQRRDASSGVVIRGTCEPGATEVRLVFDSAPGTEHLTEIDTANNTWTYVLRAGDIDAMEQGHETITVTQTDAAGNTGTASASLNLNIDTVVPDAPAIASISTDSASDQTTINAAERNSQAGVLISGTKEAGASVTLRLGQRPDGSFARTIEIAASAAESWSYTLTEDDYSAMGEGLDAFSVTQTDAAGNTSVALAALDISVDTNAPLAPTVTAVSAGASINAAERDAGVTLSGTGEVGATVTVHFSHTELGNTISTEVGTATVGNDGNWSVRVAPDQIPQMASGSVSFTATQTDVAGNPSVDSDAVQVNVDTEIGSIALLRPPAFIGLGDVDLTAFNGTCDIGASVRLYLDGDTVGRAIDVTNGTFRFTFSELEVEHMQQGEETLKLVQTDDAGNSSELTFRVHVDTLAPDMPGFEAVGGGSQIINASMASAGVTLKGTCEPNAQVTVHIDGGDLNGQALVAQTTNGRWQLVLTLEQLASLTDGRYSFQVIQQDEAGNQSESAGRSITIDKTPPIAPTIGVLNGDTNFTSADLANGGTVTLTGSKEANASVTLHWGLRSDGTFARTITSPHTTSTTWSYTLNPEDYLAMGQGADQISVTQTDLGGNTGIATTLDVDVDLSTIAAPTIDTVAGNNIINATERDAPTGVTIKGTKESGATVLLIVRRADDSSKAIEVTLASSQSTEWSYVMTSSDYTVLGEGVMEVVARSFDATKGLSPDSTLQLTIDTVAPAGPPTIVGNITGDNIINAQEAANGVTLTGTCEPNAKVHLSITLSLHIMDVEATVVGTTWTCFLSSATIKLFFGTGDVEISFNQEDAAGNLGPTSSFMLSNDFIAPDAPTIGVLGGDTNITRADFANGGAVTLTGSKEPNASITLHLGLQGDGTFAKSITLIRPASTTWSYTLTPEDYLAMGQGADQISVTQTDFAGNTGIAATLDVNVDTVALQNLSINAVSTDNTITTTEVGALITGTRENEATVSLRLGTATALTVSSGAGTSWSYALTQADITSMGLGSEDLTVTQTDRAGNVSATTTLTINVVAAAALAQQSSAGVQLASPATADLTSLWAAFNGSSTSPGTPQDAPLGWFGTLAVQSDWSDQASATGHYTVSVGGVVAEAQDNALHYVALQVL